MKELQGGRQRALVEFFSKLDRIVAVSGWLREMLIANGVPGSKIVLCRHGSSQSVPTERRAASSQRDGTFRLAFLGRLNHAKGVHVLVEAIRRRPRISLELDIFGIVQDDADYVEALRKRIGDDSRVRLLEPLPNNEVVERLRNYDALAVPSHGMETGPLVVYDAFLAGIPVIGSKRGGIAELVTHERDGLLVEASDPEAWAAAIERLASDRRLQQQLRSGVQPPRSMSAVAAEMADLYANVLRLRNTGASLHPPSHQVPCEATRT